MKKLATLFLMVSMMLYSATCLASDSGKHVLMLVTNSDQFDSGRKTGVWLEEFAVPYNLFTKAGMQVTVASLKGGISPIDPGSMKNAPLAEWKIAMDKLGKTEKISNVNYKEYDALVIPGGHGPLYDMSNNREIDTVLSYFFAEKKIVASVCHGPGTLLTAKDKNSRPVVADKTMTGFTNAEEKLAKTDNLVPYSLEDKAKINNANFVINSPWSDHIEIDGNLITGQNPQSSKSMALAVINMLGGN